MVRENINPWKYISIEELAFVTDFTANGSFADLRTNVEYKSKPDYAILIRLVDFSNKWNGDFVFVPKHSYEFLKKSKLEVGDVIISNIGAHAGTLFIVPDLGKPITLGPNALVIKTNDFPSSSNHYIYYYLCSGDGQKKIKEIIANTAQPKFNKTDFRKIKIPIPPTLSEQESIAEFLSDVDAYIGSLEELIAKKRMIKQGTIQELLTGKCRLPGFNADWEEKTVGDCGLLTMGQSPPGASYNSEFIGLPLLNGAAELKEEGIFISKYTTKPTRTCKPGDLLFCIRATIGNLHIADKEFCLGRGVAALTVNDNLNKIYISYKLRELFGYMRIQAEGGVIKGLRKDE